MPQGIPKALTEDEVEALLGAVIGDDATFAPRPRHPRDALRHRRAHQRARRPRPRATSTSTTDWCACSARAARSASSPSDARPAGALDDVPRRRPSRARRPGRAARGDGEAVILNARGGRLSRQSCWKIVRTAGERVGLAGACHPTCCATRARRTCSSTAPTSGSCRSCSATPASRRPRCTRRSRPSGSGRSTRRAHPRARAPEEVSPGRASRLLAHGRDAQSGAARPPARRSAIASHDQLRQLGVGPGGRLDFDEGFADSGQVTAERGEVEALGGTLLETLRRDRGRARASSTPAPTAGARRAGARSPRRGSRRCRRPDSASTCASSRR